jgi:hypothetical protein
MFFLNFAPIFFKICFFVFRGDFELATHRLCCCSADDVVAAADGVVVGGGGAVGVGGDGGEDWPAAGHRD